MNHDEALQKVAKLLRLAQSSNPHEAALAASRAQEIMDRFKIERLAVEQAQNGSGQPAEEIKDFGIDPLDGSYQSWKGQLAIHLSRLNSCKVYKTRRNLNLIGRASDVTTVRYLYGWLSREVERLAKRDCAGMGRTYWNNYRIGVVETIAARLRTQRGETDRAMKAEAVSQSNPTDNSRALLIVENAIAEREKQSAEVEAWTKQNMHLRGGGGSRYQSNYSAREAGRAAGHSVRLGGSAGSLRNGNLRLG